MNTYASSDSGTSAAYFVGLDGGGTGCRARLEDASGRLLAQAEGGPANIYQAPREALEQIEHCVAQLFCQADLGRDAQLNCHVGVGMAGAELPSSGAALADWHPPWGRVVVQNDAHTACLGAHGGADGALVVVGTGIVGCAVEAGVGQLVDGWGFPLADQGSGAWLGQRAIQESLRAWDGMRAGSGLTERIMAHFDHQPRTIPEWAKRASSGDFGQFARWVVEAARGDQDPLAVELMAEQATEVVRLIRLLQSRQSGPVAMLGGLAPFVAAELSDSLRESLVRAQEDAVSGALYMIRRSVEVHD